MKIKKLARPSFPFTFLLHIHLSLHNHGW
jgi:hypothetical protein